MNTPTTSLAPLPAAKALQAATAMRTWLAQSRAKEREQCIATVMAGHRIKTGWFRSRPCTRAEAEALVDRPGDEVSWDDPWLHQTWWRIAYGGNETLADQLEAAARYSADGNVWLNLRQFDLAVSFLPEEASDVKEAAS